MSHPDHPSEVKAEAKKKALEEIAQRLRDLSGSPGEQKELTLRARQHQAIEVMLKSWDLNIITSIKFLMETAIGMAIINKKEGADTQEVLNMLTEEWGRKIAQARAKAGIVDRILQEMDDKQREQWEREGEED